jgi:SAM-dependent methyltransferase
MHQEVKRFIRQVRKETRSKYWMNSFFRNKNVLEIGSLDINGSISKYFWGGQYVGVDLIAGKGVDLIGDITSDTIEDKICWTKHILQFDTVISCEMLEHCERWDKALKNMYSLLKSKGLLILTCAAPDREEHGTESNHPDNSPATNNYYGNISIEQFRDVLPRNLFTYYHLQYARGMNDLQFYGIKK